MKGHEEVGGLSLTGFVWFVAEPEEAWLKTAEAQPEAGVKALPDFSSMTEEEQIAYAMQMSLSGGGTLSHACPRLHCVFAIHPICVYLTAGGERSTKCLQKYLFKGKNVMFNLV